MSDAKISEAMPSDDLLDQLSKYLPSKLMDRVNDTLAATGKRQVGEAAILRKAAAVLDMWEGDPNATGYMGDFKDACAILEVLALHATPTAQQVGEVKGPAAFVEHFTDRLTTLALTPLGLELGVGKHPLYAARQPVGQDE